MPEKLTSQQLFQQKSKQMHPALSNTHFVVLCRAGDVCPRFGNQPLEQPLGPEGLLLMAPSQAAGIASYANVFSLLG